MTKRNQNLLYATIVALCLLVLVMCGRTVLGDEPLTLNTKTHKVVSPLTIDWAGVTILNWPLGGGVSSVFGRSGAVTAQSGDYSAFYPPLSAIPTGGSTGQVLTKTSATNYATSWQTPTTPTPAPTPPVSSVFTRTGAITAQSGDYAAFYQPLGSYEVPLTFSQSLSRATNTITLTGDSATPGTSRYYGTDSSGSKGFFALPTFTAPVTSVFTRTGAVTAQSGDYSAFYAPLAAAVPTGGTSGQVLTKNSATNYDTAWSSPSGTGTVTSFSAGDLFPLFTTTEATVTTTPALSFVLSNAAANSWFGNATASSAAPAYNGAAALTETDDTNVTLALGGTPATALLKSVSLTLGWSGTLSQVRGGFGANITSVAANTVYGNPAGISGAPSFTSSPRFTAIANLTSNGFVKTGSSNGTLSVDTSTYLTGNQTITLTGDATGSGTTSIATTVAAKLPTGGTTGQVLTKTSATNYAASWQTPTTGPVFLINSSVANQTGFAADQYLTGSNVTYTAGSWAAGGVYHCLFHMAKTAAGTATPIVTVRAGTTGTASDAAVGSASYTAGTAATDDATFEMWFTVRTTGASGGTSTVGRVVTSGGGMTGGTTAWTQVKSATSGTIDTTTATNIGVSFNGGTSFQGTCRLVSAEYKQ